MKIKPKQKIVITCCNFGCRAQFALELEPLAKSGIVDMLIEREIKYCPVCGVNKLEYLNNFKEV